MIVTKEEILFESYISSIGYFYKNSRVYVSKRSNKYIAKIEISESKISIKGYGYPTTVTSISKQVEYLFQKQVELVFEGDHPTSDMSYYY